MVTARQRWSRCCSRQVVAAIKIAAAVSALWLFLIPIALLHTTAQLKASVGKAQQCTDRQVLPSLWSTTALPLTSPEVGCKGFDVARPLVALGLEDRIQVRSESCCSHTIQMAV
eukprot:SAG11_NODE_1463_length_4863_cov_15.348657_2_plen_114_part_00